MNVHPGALKHGISAEDAIQAASWPIWIEDFDDDSPCRQFRLGFDTHGRLLETVVLAFDSGNELVIHAMKARPQMLDLLPWLRFAGGMSGCSALMRCAGCSAAANYD